MKETFWTVTCEHLPQLRLLVSILFVLLLLTVFSILYTMPGTASHIIALFDLVLVLLGLVIAFFLQWRCAKNEQQQGEWRPEKRRE